MKGLAMTLGLLMSATSFARDHRSYDNFRNPPKESVKIATPKVEEQKAETVNVEDLNKKPKKSLRESSLMFREGPRG